MYNVLYKLRLRFENPVTYEVFLNIKTFISEQSSLLRIKKKYGENTIFYNSTSNQCFFEIGVYFEPEDENHYADIKITSYLQTNYSDNQIFIDAIYNFVKKFKCTIYLMASVEKDLPNFYESIYIDEFYNSIKNRIDNYRNFFNEHYQQNKA